MEEKEVEIDSIRVAMKNLQRTMVLKEKASKRYFAIWMDEQEANAIAAKLQGITHPRPLTHDFLCSVITALKGTVESAVITDCKKGILYAKVIIKTASEKVEVDCRPSDAVAVAVRAGKPIFAYESVLEKAGITVAE